MATLLKSSQGAVNIWMSEHGQYVIPERFNDIGIVIAKHGWPDRRYTASKETEDFRRWIAEQDAIEQLDEALRDEARRSLDLAAAYDSGRSTDYVGV